MKQIYIGVNEMNFDTIGYTQQRYDEIASEMKNMFAQVGWKTNLIASERACAPFPDSDG